jgi:hypothetical protein
MSRGRVTRRTDDRTRARRVGLTAGVLTGLLATAAGPAAAESPRNAHVFQNVFAGYVAQAVWSTCPEEPAPGTLCTTTDVMAFLSADREQADSELHLHSRRSPGVKVFQGTCRVAELEGDLLCIPLEERFGNTSAATVTVSPLLDFVVASAEDLPVHISRPDGEDSEGTLDVSVSWTGTGTRTAIDEREHVAERDVTIVGGTRGWRRDCTAVGEIDGAPIPGDLTFCELFRVRQGEIRVFREHVG